MLPSDKCHVLLSQTITYVTFCITTLFLGNILCLLNLLTCVLLFTGYIFDAATKTSSNLTKTANTNSLPFRVFRHLKIATTS